MGILNRRGNWPKPIETAPKDGTTVNLIWRPNDVTEYQVRSHWNRERQEWQGGWTPTHWQPVNVQQGE